MMPVRLSNRSPGTIEPLFSHAWSWRAVGVSLLAHTFVTLGVWVWQPIEPRVQSPPSTPLAVSPEPIFIDFPGIQETDPAALVNPPFVRSSFPADSLPAVERPPADVATAFKVLPNDEVQNSQQLGVSSASFSSIRALSSGLQDSRLYVGSAGAGEASRSATRLQADIRTRIITQDDSLRDARQENITRRQVNVFGQRVTVLGDSAASRSRTLGAAFAGSRMVMPTDGRGWEDSEMQRQREEFVRDSILRDRARAMRERQN